MMKRGIGLVVSLCAVTIFGSCGGGGGGSSTSSNPASIDVASGFSTAYLQGKSFYWPKNSGSTKFVQTRTFTDSTVTWSDDMYNTTGTTASYSIISANGINGVIKYNDGVYDLFFNVQSVASDHLMVCYKYTGSASVSACSAAEAWPWYFDKATAQANYPAYP